MGAVRWRGQTGGQAAAAARIGRRQRQLTGDDEVHDKGAYPRQPDLQVGVTKGGVGVSCVRRWRASGQQAGCTKRGCRVGGTAAQRRLTLPSRLSEMLVAPYLCKECAHWGQAGEGFHEGFHEGHSRPAATELRRCAVRPAALLTGPKTEAFNAALTSRRQRIR